jgi:hypothetical protein
MKKIKIIEFNNVIFLCNVNSFKFNIRNRFENIIIHFDDFIITIEFFNHATTNSQYVKNLQTFVNKCKKEVLIVKKFNLNN